MSGKLSNWVNHCRNWIKRCINPGISAVEATAALGDFRGLHLSVLDPRLPCPDNRSLARDLGHQRT